MAWTNVGEMENLIALLNEKAVFVGLYKNVLVPTDGSLTWASVQEMPTGGGRGYARIPLARAMNFSSLASGQWYLSLNAGGKYQGQYNNAALQWVMTSQEVTDANTVQGVFGACLVVPFQNGAIPINAGDFIQGGASGATAKVSAVVLLTGSWAAGTAAGYLYIESQVGPFQNNENIILVGRIIGVTPGANEGANYANGDIFSITQANAADGLAVVGANNSGAANLVGLLKGGENYTTANGLATSKVAGGGDNNLTANIVALPSVVAAKTNTGSVNAGDAWIQLLFVEAMATPQQVVTIGQPYVCTPILSAGQDPTLT